MKNFRVLDIYQIKLIKHNKNFEPNLLSFFILNHQLQAVCLQILQNGFLHRYFFKEKLWYENTVNLKSIYGLTFFFHLFWFACWFFLFRLLNILFQYFTSIKNLPVTKNSLKNNWLNIKNNIFKFKFYKVLHAVHPNE